MGWFGNVLGAAAPLAAGYFTGGAGFGMGSSIAAGAATGMGIAALNGNDLLMGGVSGGLGGYGGGNMYSAFNPAVATQAAVKEGTTTAVMNNEMLSPYTGVAQGTQEAAKGSQLGMFSNANAVNQGVSAGTTGITGANGQIAANMGQVNPMTQLPHL